MAMANDKPPEYVALQEQREAEAAERAVHEEERIAKEARYAAEDVEAERVGKALEVERAAEKVSEEAYRKARAESARIATEEAAKVAKAKEVEEVAKKVFEPPKIVEPTYPKDVKPDRAGGQVATIVGEKVYLPGFTMYEMGFRTNQEYLDAQSRGVAYGIHPGNLIPTGSVIVKDTISGRETALRISPADMDAASRHLLVRVKKQQFFVPTDGVLMAGSTATKISKLKGETQFKAMVAAGIIEKGAVFVAGKKPDEWGWLTKAQAEKEVIAKKYITPENNIDIIKARRDKIPPSVLKEWGATAKHIAQADAIITLQDKGLLDKEGNFYLGEAIEAKIPYSTLVMVGIEKLEYDKAVSDIAKEKWAVKALAPYKAPDDKGYYIKKALDSDKPKAIAAVYALYDPETIRKAIQPKPPVTPSKEAIARAKLEFLNESKIEQRIIIGDVLLQEARFAPITPEKPFLRVDVPPTRDFKKLSTKEQKQVIEYYAGLESEIETKWGTIVAPKWMDLNKEGIETTVAFTPIVGTIYFWDDMTPGQQALSIAGDAFFFVAPFIIPKVVTTVASVRLLGMSKAGKAIDKIVRAGSKDTIALLRKVNKPAAKALQKVANAQTRYAQNLVKVRDIQTALKAKRVAGRARLKSNLAKAKVAAEKSKLLLSEQAQAYVDIIKRTMPKHLDDPAVLETFTRMARDLPEWTDDMVKAATASEKANILELKASLLKAQDTLLKAKEKFPIDPSKWADLSQDVAVIEVKLMAAQSGDISILQRQLVTAREILPVLRGKVREARRIKSPYLADLEAELARAKSLTDTLPGKIDRAIKTMEVEWGRGGSMGGGRVAPAIKSPRGIRATGIAAAKPTTATMTLTQLARMLGLSLTESAYFKDFARIIEVGPDALRKYKVKPALVPKPVPSALPKPSVVPTPKPALVPTPALARAPMPTPAPAIALVPAPAPKPVPTRKPTPVPTPKLIKPIEPLKPLKPVVPILPRGVPDNEKRKIIKDADGAIAWRHGELHGKDVWHVGLYPYESEENWGTVVGKKPTGATIVKGPGSAFQTIKLLYGKAPARKVTGDVGFFDFSIEPKDGRKVGIGFIPDPKMQTTGDISLGRRTPPITEKRLSLTGRGKSPRITPKTPSLRR